MTSPKASYQPT
uniref:Uncharacterized protein MANES_16G062100 n=1 Tax=Rhizophora mucronata TaxID=61149 RepID=A0A2P2MN02_RHIMU